MCGQSPCLSPTCTWSESPRAACEAREVMRWSGEERRAYYAKVRAVRGQDSAAGLIAAVNLEWKDRSRVLSGLFEKTINHDICWLSGRTERLSVSMTATGFSIYAQIISASSGSKPGAKQRTAGRMRSPLAHLVLAYLCGQHEYLRQHEIREGTGLRHSAACWALLLLRRHGLVDAVPDPVRNGRYLRYKARAV